MLPNYGLAATAKASVWELRLSHWKGAIAELDVKTNWAYRSFDHIFGTFTYLGKPVYGFKSKPSGEPLDTFGRNIYVDTFDSAYGSGWRRENSFLTHKGTGVFCYGFYSHGSRPVGKGQRYRATVIGPGVDSRRLLGGLAARHVRQVDGPPAARRAEVALLVERRAALQGRLTFAT